jgi:hypothetical protein
MKNFVHIGRYATTILMIQLSQLVTIARYVMIVYCPELRKIVNNGLPNVYLSSMLFARKG